MLYSPWASLAISRFRVRNSTKTSRLFNKHQLQQRRREKYNKEPAQTHPKLIIPLPTPSSHPPSPPRRQKSAKRSKNPTPSASQKCGELALQCTLIRRRKCRVRLPLLHAKHAVYTLPESRSRLVTCGEVLAVVVPSMHGAHGSRHTVDRTCCVETRGGRWE